MHIPVPVRRERKQQHTFRVFQDMDLQNLWLIKETILEDEGTNEKGRVETNLITRAFFPQRFPLSSEI
jgi:hypothetical protein